MFVLTSQQMRRVDERAGKELGIDSETLMDNAGSAIADTLGRLYPDLASTPPIILCGKGNNGGDGVATARHLLARGIPSRVVLLAPASEYTGAAAAHLSLARKSGVRLEEAHEESAWSEVAADLDDHAVIVDALLGTGLSGGARGLMARAIGDINAARGPEIVSVDIPSGLSGDTSDIPGPAVQADHTIALAFPKMANAFDPACLLTGRLHVVDIGIPPEAVRGVTPIANLTTEQEAASLVPPREPSAHKGDFGRILVVGGSRGKSGAVALAGLAALRSGAGLVTAAVPHSSQAVVAGHVMEMMTEHLPETPHGAISSLAEPFLRKLVEERDVLAIGPGLTTEQETMRLVRHVVTTVLQPIVLDADGLNAFEGHVEDLEGKDRVLILTPHPGEMARLTGMTPSDVQADRVKVATDFAAARGCYVALKGRHTVVSGPDGLAWINPTGNAGMATAGSGDVLTGVLAGLLGQGLSPMEACVLGVYIHGLAGDLAAGDLGETAIIAGDIIDFLPEAFDCLTS